MPTNETTLPDSYLPLETCRPVPVLPATWYPVMAAVVPVAPLIVVTACSRVRIFAAVPGVTACWVGGAAAGVPSPSGAGVALPSCGCTPTPLLAIAAYAAVICSGVTEMPMPIGIEP